jgi:hypothetical protein
VRAVDGLKRRAPRYSSVRREWPCDPNTLGLCGSL